MRADFEGDERGRCGGCGSRNMMQANVKADTIYGVCMDCERLQEIELRDWPESQMCGNCAFRQGSPERADPYRWAEVQETLEKGQAFHCHKGLPFDHNSGQFKPPSQGAGRVTVCAGWLASYIAKQKRNETKTKEKA